MLSKHGTMIRNNEESEKKMVELLSDIETLESAVISLTEGASDEKRMAIHSLESMIAEKKASFEKFETEMEKEMGVI